MRRGADVLWRHAVRRGRRAPGSCLCLERGNPIRTRGKEKQASSVSAFGGPTRPKKPVRRCFKLRPPWRAGFAGFASGCRLLSGSGVATWMPAGGIHPYPTIDPLRPLAAVRPLVRMPTNRHAATGTCEIGQGGRYGPRPRIASPDVPIFAGFPQGGRSDTVGPGRGTVPARGAFSSEAGRAINRPTCRRAFSPRAILFGIP
jgi:hypothetical protein